ncbi:hypothetical protein BFP72_16065 [Reichenbachiella sp. 5M10]|uniref:LytR/AlgR family response regulator transcription factor n=1 Tax=Reichenbachiella sp. 5M10 TaxID=1889772 RepID=UPI000C1529EB|nr:response regulator [Reichenbachiella sp. 5M10]PIB36808.1 hypothetical protein BFP72_16065 [Reichenbachiella sp. 5M10]
MKKETYSCVCIDDDRLFIEILTSKINQLDYLELQACYTSPLSALVKVDQLKPEIIFLDIDMPDINGFAFVEALDYDPVVIMITSHWEHLETAQKKGIHGFISKPIKSAEQISDILIKVL